MVNRKAKKSKWNIQMAKNNNYDDQKRFSKDNVSLAKDFPVKYATFNAY